MNERSTTTDEGVGYSDPDRNSSGSSVLDRARIWGAGLRYDFWLDLNSVPAKRRRSLRSELRANLTEAAASVGATIAIRRVGSLRSMARESVVDDVSRPRWLAGWWAGLSTLAALVVLFMLMSLVYAEGVLDSGVTTPVSSGLFPFVGSEITIDPSPDGGGIALSMSPGFGPFVAALVVFVLVARPWRLLGSGSRLADVRPS